MHKITMFEESIFNFFVSDGEVIEVRLPKTYGKSPAWGNEYSKGVVAGYFDGHQAFCQAVKKADQERHEGIYFTLQVIDPRLIGRAFNRLKPSIITTSDHNVISYRWLPIDFDPVRPAGISASKPELIEALKLRQPIIDFLKKEFGLSDPIQAISGNGAHLLFRLPDIPATPDNQEFIKGVLEQTAQQFDNDKVHIDTTIHNPARIWKLYGTTAKKGDPIPEGPHREARPHRMAYINSLGALA